MKLFKVIFLGVFISVILFASAGCTPKPVVHQKVKWLFLVYLDGDNNLEPEAITDFNEMEQVGSTDDVTILTLFDRSPLHDVSNGNWTGTRLYKVTRDNDLHTIHSELQTASPWGKTSNRSEADMSDPQTLSDFIVYCQRYYPADHTVLTLWDHGGGVMPKSLGRQVTKTALAPKSGEVLSDKGICWDDTTGAATGEHVWNCLTTDEVASALANARSQTGQKIDLINMDACLMQMLEVAYEWKDETDYIVGSEETVPGDGNNYHTLLTKLTQDPGMTAEEFANCLVDDYYANYEYSGYSTTYSVLKLGAPLDSFMTCFEALAVKLNNTPDLSWVYNAWYHTTSFEDYPEFSDLYDFASKLIDYSSDSEVTTAATDLQNAFSGFVMKHHETGTHTSTSPAYGLSFFMTSSVLWGYYSGSNQYVSLALCKDTVWDDFIKKFVNYTATL